MTPADLRNQFQKETGESPNIATYAYWLEQRLLLSSEAEKGPLLIGGSKERRDNETLGY